uniref:Odorant receptor n=1 Tax=Lobesia botrana TaxID=209534 RepID=A0A345BET2_9NEOP|nr:odorant receptors OR1 [Lobesia botrana]
MALSNAVERFKKILDDTDGAESPLQFRYIRQTSLLLIEVGCWPYSLFGETKKDKLSAKYNLFLFCLGVALPFLGIAHLYTHRSTMTFFDMGNTILIMCLDFIYTQRLIMVRQDKYYGMLKDFLFEFHLYYFKNKSEYANKIFFRLHLISGAFVIYVIFQLHVGISLFNLIPLMANYKKGMFGPNRPENSTFIPSAYYYVPKDLAYTTLSGYWGLFAFNVFMSVMIAGTLTNLDLLIYLIVLQIWGHLKVLKNSMYSFPLPKPRLGDVDNGMYTAEENEHIRRLLCDVIEHHQLIIRFVDKCSDTLGLYLFMFYSNIQVISCLLLLEMSSLSPEALVRYGILFFAVYVTLIECSVLFELLNTKSTELIDAIYEMPWECMNTSNRKTVMFLLYRSQTPLSVKAAKVVPVGVQTMLTVLKTSCSYFMLLRTAAAEH